jgi:transposase
VGHPGGLTDEQWSLIEPLLPNRAPQRGGRRVDHRLIIDAVAWRQRTGLPWPELPDRFGPWQTAYHRYTVWGRDGTWDKIRDRLRACPTPEDGFGRPAELAPAGLDTVASPERAGRDGIRVSPAPTVVTSSAAITIRSPLRSRPPVGARPPGA